MADDKSNTGSPDSDRVAGGQAYELRHFAEKHGISHDAARKLIDEIGTDRAKLDAAAVRLKKR